MEKALLGDGGPLNCASSRTHAASRMAATATTPVLKNKTEFH